MFDASESTPDNGSAPSPSDAPPSAYDALILLESAPGLTEKQRENRLSAVRTYVRIRKPEFSGGKRNTSDTLKVAREVPMDCPSMNEYLFKRSAAFHKLSSQSFTGLVSLLRDVLRFLGQHGPALPAAADLAPEWSRLYRQLSSERQRGVIAFFGYCTLHGVLPGAVTTATLQAFLAWSTDRTLHRNPRGRATRCASNWNWASGHIPGWPGVRLVMPSMRDEYTLPLERYLPSLQADIRVFLDRLACRDRRDIFPDEVTSASFRSPRSRRKPLKTRTIETRSYQIRQILAALVGSGIPIEDLPDLRAVVQPVERVRAILEFHVDRRAARLRVQEEGDRSDDPDEEDGWNDHRRPDDHQSSNLAGIGETLRQIAKFHCALPEKEVTRISGWVAAVKPPQQTTMTPKNAERLRDLLEPHTYGRLLHHPQRLMLWADPRERQRLKMPEMKPRARALLALYAVALEILLVCPMRRENLAKLRLDRSLPRSGGALISHLVVHGSEVKNGTPIDWPLPRESAELIETYLREHRPHLAEPGNPYLFPGQGRRSRAAHDLGVGLIERIEGDIGAKINPHLLRHMAVVRFLTLYPGQYEIVRRILGHRSVKTTIAFYSGPEMDAAIALFLSVLRSGRLDPRFNVELRYPSGGRSSARD